MASNHPRTDHRRAEHSKAATTFLSTPYYQKVSSTLGTDVGPKKFVRPRLDTILAREVQYSILTFVPRLVETLFPDELFPPLIRQKLPAILKELYRDGCWDKFPTGLNESEAENRLASFLNHVTSKLTNLSYWPKNEHGRIWSGRYNNKPLPGAGLKRKPDLILVDRLKRETTWDDVVTIGELTTLGFTPTIRKTLLTKSYLIFKAQEDRRYVISIAICGNSFYVTFCDRAGVCHSQELNIDNNRDKFLRVLVGLNIASRPWLGYDPTITSDINRVRMVFVDEPYVIKSTIFRSNVVRGRATICWHGTRDNKDYAIKDTWADTSRDFTEQDILTEIRDIEGVPRVVQGIIVEFNGEDTTDRRRQALTMSKIVWTRRGRSLFRKLENRVHRRLVLQPLGIPVVCFSSKEELISVFIDIVKSKHHRIVPFR
jgi:hypothetical protein